MSRFSSAWLRWLGPTGSVPPPLDVFLSRERADRATFVALSGGAAWAVCALASMEERAPAPGGIELLDQLRAADPEELLSRTAALGGAPAGRPIRRALDRIRNVDPPTWEARCVRAGVPSGWANSLARRAERSGVGPVTAFLDVLGQRPPLWVRPRGPEVAGALVAEGFQVEAYGAALRVEGPDAVERSGPYVSGRLEIQDLASQHAGALALPRPGQRVWDVCAGRGGKTTQLADALGGRGAVHATDVDERKLTELKRRVKRAGLADVVRIRSWDGRSVPAFGPEARAGFQVVFVDAPCSSSGTWRRNPDARLRVDPAEAPRFSDLQRSLLALGIGQVRPGGRWVYATCSWLVEECEDVALAMDLPFETHLFGPPELDADSMFVAVGGARP